MTSIKPSDHGIVVAHLEAGAYYAIQDHQYDAKVHRKIRDLRADESVISYRPKPKLDESASDEQATNGDVFLDGLEPEQTTDTDGAGDQTEGHTEDNNTEGN